MALFQDFPVLENAIIKFQDFPGFQGPARTLHKNRKTLIFPSERALNGETIGSHLKSKTNIIYDFLGMARKRKALGQPTVI